MKVVLTRPTRRANCFQQQIVTFIVDREEKDVNFYVRSRDVYENKEKHDKLSGEISDIFGNSEPNRATFWCLGVGKSCERSYKMR